MFSSGSIGRVFVCVGVLLVSACVLAADYAADTRPVAVAVGDFNHDGCLDVITANDATSSANMLMGNGTGALGTATSISSGNPARAIVTADFDADGYIDLAVVRDGAAILRNTGNIFDSYNPVLGIHERCVVVGDFTNDGKQDFFIGWDNGRIEFYQGDGTCGFAGPSPWIGSSSGATIGAVGDFNRDGSLDAVFSAEGANSISVLFGYGAGALSGELVISIGATVSALAVADFNCDGKLDIAVATGAANSVGILFGNGSGNFEAPVFYNVGSTPSALTVADFNGNGKPDIAVANLDSNSVTILRNTGSGAFVSAGSFAVGSGPCAIASGDLNNDGTPDIVTANRDGNSVSVLIVGQTPTITGLTPLSLPAGSADTEITLRGTKFCSGLTSVQLNGQNKPATVVSSTELHFTATASELEHAGDTSIVVSNSSPFSETASIGFEIINVGSQGPAGPKGDKGDTGLTGPKGLQGEQGPKGDTGAVGPQGPAGAKGDTGPQGEAGPQGEIGSMGPQGEQGPKGDLGAAALAQPTTVGTIIMLERGSVPPDGFALIGNFKQSVKQPNGRAKRLDIDVYKKN